MLSRRPDILARSRLAWTWLHQSSSRMASTTLTLRTPTLMLMSGCPPKNSVTCTRVSSMKLQSSLLKILSTRFVNNLPILICFVPAKPKFLSRKGFKRPKQMLTNTIQSLLNSKASTDTFAVSVNLFRVVSSFLVKQLAS